MKTHHLLIIRPSPNKDSFFFNNAKGGFILKLSGLYLVLADYIMDIKLPRNIPKYRDNFKNKSYAKWSVQELLMYITRNKNQSPTESTIEFIKKMDDFSKIRKKDKNMFLIARDIAKDILDIFNAMENERRLL